jgi:hypothetical protein
MNEILFIIQTIVSLFLVLLAFRMGRNWLYALIAVNYVLANIFVTKTIILFGFEATGGNVLYGAIFLGTDLLSEYYGREAARKGVYVGLAAVLVYLLMSIFITAYETSPNDFGAGAAMGILFSFAPSIIIASLIAYLISQLHDVWAFHFWKVRFEGRMLWLRNNFSTWVSQLLDSVTFAFLAFWILPRMLMAPEMQLPINVVLQIVATTYFLKIMVAAIDTPFLYLSRAWKPVDLD